MNEENLLKEIEKLKLEKEEALKLAENQKFFLASITHEIRTPLSAIIGMTNILLEESPSDKQVEVLKTMKFSADNLVKFLNDILNIAKIESGKIELEEIEINLTELVNNIKQSFMSILKQKQLEFILKIDSRIPNIILGDSLRITQLLTNLISNAIKFTDSGNITVTINLKDSRANFVEVEFSVIDTGIGIPKDKIDSIFDSFTQGEINISRKFGGTGLGLTITKKILSLMESKIQVESEINKGSKFSFSLFLKVPMVQIPQPKPKEQSQEKQSLKGLQLLLVEDNISNQKVASRYLQKWDIDVDIAENGVICLEKIKQKEYDIILMDLQMPEMDGYTASSEIRKLEDTKLKQIPIIALTASALLDTSAKVEQAGMNEYLTKPFVPNDLYKTIAKYYKKF